MIPSGEETGPISKQDSSPSLQNGVSLKSISRSASILMGGAGATQAINLLSAIVVVRLVGPGEFGLFAIFTSIHALCLVFTTMRYELAVVVDGDEDDAVSILVLATLLIVLVSFLSGGLVIAAWLARDSFGIADSMVSLLWILPLSLFCAGQYLLATQWCVRAHAFRQIAVAGILTATMTLCAQVLFSVLGWSAFGLTLGYVLGQGVGMVLTWRQAFRTISLKTALERAIDLPALCKVGRRHYGFAAFQVPSTFASSAYLYFPAVLIGSAISPYAAGVFSMAFRLTFQPMTLLPAAFGQVVFSRLARSTHDLHKWESPLSTSYLLVGALLAGPAGILLVLGGPLSGLVLGADWIATGQMIQILVIPCLMMALAAGYDRLYDILRRQVLALGICVAAAASLLGAVHIASVSTHNVLWATTGFAVVHAIYALVWTVVAIKVCRFSSFKAALRFAMVLACSLFVGGVTAALFQYVTNPLVCALLVEGIHLLVLGGALLKMRSALSLLPAES